MVLGALDFNAAFLCFNMRCACCQAKIKEGSTWNTPQSINPRRTLEGAVSKWRLSGLSSCTGSICVASSMEALFS